MYCIISSSICLLEVFLCIFPYYWPRLFSSFLFDHNTILLIWGLGSICVCVVSGVCWWWLWKKGLKINLAIKQDSANISNYGVKTTPLDSNVLLISHPSKVTYYIARVEHKTVFPMHLFSSQKGLALRPSCRLQHTLD